jgi:imidazolonepropionase-like amidohydrolase
MERPFVSLLALLCFTVTGPGQISSGSFLIRDVRVFDGERVLDHRAVFVDKGKIVRIDDGSAGRTTSGEIIDGHDRTLLPGLFDCHIHVAQDVIGALRQSLVLGITTELDMFNGGDRLQRIKLIESEDPSDLSDLRTAGVGATVPGGHPTQMGGGPFPTISTPDQAQAFVDARIAEGSDYIKIVYDDLASLGPRFRAPMLNRETLTALIQAAHARGRLAVAHIGTESQARDAIAAGVDGLAHMFTGSSAATDFGRFAAAHHIFVIPTLSILYSVCGKGNAAALLGDSRLKLYLRAPWQQQLESSWPFEPESCEATRQGLRELIAAHVPILAGTDAPAPGTAYGASLHGELALLVSAGMTPLQALVGATSAPARAFHLADRGLIRPGLRADLVLVEGNPTTDILATRSIVSVWKRGNLVQRGQGR